MLKRSNSSKLRTLVQIGLAAYLIILLTATHLPPNSRFLPSEINNIDKLCHFSAYAIFAVLLATTWRATARAGHFRQLFWTWVAVAVFGTLDELTQIPVGRDCDFWDWIADATGAAVGLLIFAWLREKFAARFSRGTE
jgi:VanZ family protein